MPGLVSRGPSCHHTSSIIGQPQDNNNTALRWGLQQTDESARQSSPGHQEHPITSSCKTRGQETNKRVVEVRWRGRAQQFCPTVRSVKTPIAYPSAAKGEPPCNYTIFQTPRPRGRAPERPRGPGKRSTTRPTEGGLPTSPVRRRGGPDHTTLLPTKTGQTK